MLCKLQIGEYTYCICNIYAPNFDSPGFFEGIFEKVRRMDCVFDIIGGDFNEVQDGSVDRSSKVVYHKKSHLLLIL